MDRRDRPLIHDLRQRLALAIVELGRIAWRLAVDQAVRSFAIETQYPIADDLEPDAADPRPIRAPAAVINLCQSQKPAALPRKASSATFALKAAEKFRRFAML